MLTTYFKRQTTLTTYYAGPTGPYLDDFTDWLTQRGYQHESIRRRIQGAVLLGTWSQTTGCSLRPLSLAILNDFRGYLSLSFSIVPAVEHPISPQRLDYQFAMHTLNIARNS